MWNILDPESGEMTLNPNAIEMIEVKKVMTDSSKMPGLNIDLIEGHRGTLDNKRNLLESLEKKYLEKLCNMVGSEAKYSRFNYSDTCKELEQEVLSKYSTQIAAAEKIEVVEIHDKAYYLSSDLLALMTLDHSTSIVEAKTRYLEQLL